MTGISTKDATPGPKPEDKRENMKKLREFHQPMLDALGLSDATFIPKLAYVPHGKTERFNALFLSEISKGVDLYIEFADSNNLPQFEDRALYRWKFNPHFEEEYEKTEPSSTTGQVRYLVPIAELTKVELPEHSQPEIPFDLTDPEQDLPMNQMTMRDYAAIHMRKPVSRKPWLNELITKNP
jgi:hypothetical protein